MNFIDHADVSSIKNQSPGCFGVLYQELMQALQTSGRAMFNFHWIYFAVPDQQVIDFRVTVFACSGPIKQLIVLRSSGCWLRLESGKRGRDECHETKSLVSRI
jgi:hypothetical protein